MKAPDWIEKLARSSYQLFIHHDPKAHLPFDAWGLHPLYNDLWLKKLYEMVTIFREKDYQVKDYLDYFPNLSSTRFIALMVLIHHQTSKMNNPKLVTTIEDFLVESIKLRAKKDLFAYDANIEYSDAELKKILSERPLNKVSLEESREIGKILVALASLTHGLYNDWCTDFDYEISGPYYLSGKMILVRTFPDIRPIDIWPNISWPYDRVSIITEYKNLKAKIAFVGCHITYSDNVVEKLTGYNLEVDGKVIKGLEKLKKLRDELMPIAASQFEKFMKMDFENQKIKFLYQEHYQFKKLFDLLEIDWKPTKEMIQKIKDKQLLKNIFPSYDLSLEKYKQVFGFNKLIKAYSPC